MIAGQQAYLDIVLPSEILQGLPQRFVPSAFAGGDRAPPAAVYPAQRVEGVLDGVHLRNVQCFAEPASLVQGEMRRVERAQELVQYLRNRGFRPGFDLQRGSHRRAVGIVTGPVSYLGGHAEVGGEVNRERLADRVGVRGAAGRVRGEVGCGEQRCLRPLGRRGGTQGPVATGDAVSVGGYFRRLAQLSAAVDDLELYLRTLDRTAFAGHQNPQRLELVSVRGHHLLPVAADVVETAQVRCGFDRTMAIDTLGVGTTEFDLSRERAMDLFRSCRRGGLPG